MADVVKGSKVGTAGKRLGKFYREVRSELKKSYLAEQNTADK